FFFFQAEDGIRDATVTGVQTCALPISKPFRRGDELPGEGDGLFFEIVSEREVTQHLEKGVVAVGEPYIFEVVVLAAGANALLNGGGARVIAPLEAQEDILELVHPGIGE